MLTNIRLQQFRSYKDETFEFEAGVSIVVGPNGIGKTNLLEAILVAATGSSYRVEDGDMIMQGCAWARIDATFDDQPRSLKLMESQTTVKKTYVLDEKETRLLGRTHRIPVVLFEPNHLMLLHGLPDARRNYLDNLLEQTILGYATTRRHYRRVLAQRNRLLKNSKPPTKDQLFVWNLRLSELGGVIAKHRAELINAINKDIATTYNNIAARTDMHVVVDYASKLPIDNYETLLLKTLESSIDKDITRGFTSYGPHRDDFTVLFNQRPAEEIASRGETRTALLGLKMYELSLLEKVFNTRPLLLLDDVFSELDGKRRHALANFLNNSQAIITTTDADLVLDTQMRSSNIIPLS